MGSESYADIVMPAPPLIENLKVPLSYKSMPLRDLYHSKTLTLRLFSKDLEGYQIK